MQSVVKFTVFVGCCLISTIASGQVSECATVVTDADRVALLRQEAAGAYELPLQGLGPATWVPVAFHVVRQSNGTGGLTESRICQAMNDLDIAYANAGIQFVLHNPVDYIDSDFFYFQVNTLAAIDQLRTTNTVLNAINIYFTENLAFEGGGLCGISAFTSSNVQAIAMRNSCTATSTNHSTLPHEVGHYFDLFHTHETAFGNECVDGSNCSSAGDRLCDTPADPQLGSGNVNSSCLYTGGSTDACNNAPYTPPVHNYMSYSLKHCRNLLSLDQETKSLATLVNLRPELMNSSVWTGDCNNNGVRDDCEIALGNAPDTNGNGVPDICDVVPCAADISPVFGGGNGVVNIDDLVAVLNAFGPCPSPPLVCTADITPGGGGNGVVNIDDLVAVLNAFGPCP